MPDMLLNEKFWKNRKVFVTGHTGFKGSWLCALLDMLGADATGYALDPPTDPAMFTLAGLERLIRSVHGDVRDLPRLADAVRAARPEVVIHMAAQPIVRESYKRPAETYETNVMGTVNALESARFCGGVRAVVVVTTDKVYENREWPWGYRETDALGGFDPYSSSKACAELAAAAYRASFFHPDDYARHGTALATARAGNVIGGGDWAADRLLPDCARAVLEGRPIVVRNPGAVRPWQHALECLCGYLLLAEKLCADGPAHSSAYNFGPDDRDCLPVGEVAKRFCALWPGASCEMAGAGGPHEAGFLKLDSSKAAAKLGWRRTWGIGPALRATVDWYREYERNGSLLAVTRSQIENFLKG
jgi:CDP-glucose 4,6-dehydratase